MKRAHIRFFDEVYVEVERPMKEMRNHSGMNGMMEGFADQMKVSTEYFIAVFNCPRLSHLPTVCPQTKTGR